MKQKGGGRGKSEVLVSYKGRKQFAELREGKKDFILLFEMKKKNRIDFLPVVSACLKD